MPEAPKFNFCSEIQRLLNEGAFTATYNYALLLTLANIAVENGDDSGGELGVPISRISGNLHGSA